MKDSASNQSKNFFPLKILLGVVRFTRIMCLGTSVIVVSFAYFDSTSFPGSLSYSWGRVGENPGNEVKFDFVLGLQECILPVFLKNQFVIRTMRVAI